MAQVPHKEFEMILPLDLTPEDHLIIRANATANFTLSLADEQGGKASSTEVPFHLDFNIIDFLVTGCVITNGQTKKQYEERCAIVPGEEFLCILEPVTKSGSATMTASIAENVRDVPSYVGTVVLEHGLERMKYLKLAGHVSYVKSLKYEFAPKSI